MAMAAFLCAIMYICAMEGAIVVCCFSGGLSNSGIGKDRFRKSEKKNTTIEITKRAPRK